MNGTGKGSIELFECDLFKAHEGVFDEAFAGCVAVFHVAADIGSDPSYGERTPQRTFDSCMTATKGVLESCRKAGTVQRVVNTSSTAAIAGLGEGGKKLDGYEYDDEDWAGSGPYETIEQRWTVTSPRTGDVHNLWTLERQSYAMGKVEAEQYAYTFGEQNGFDVVSVSHTPPVGWTTPGPPVVVESDTEHPGTLRGWSANGLGAPTLDEEEVQVGEVTFRVRPGCGCRTPDQILSLNAFYITPTVNSYSLGSLSGERMASQSKITLTVNVNH